MKFSEILQKFLSVKIDLECAGMTCYSYPFLLFHPKTKEDAFKLIAEAKADTAFKVEHAADGKYVDVRIATNNSLVCTISNSTFRDLGKEIEVTTSKKVREFPPLEVLLGQQVTPTTQAETPTNDLGTLDNPNQSN